VGMGVGETWVVVGEETLERLGTDGVQVDAIANASTAAITSRDISSPSLRPEASLPI
jgi:hypothetical protein